jgi:hypothetical protein
MTEHVTATLDEKPGKGRLGRHVHHDPRSRDEKHPRGAGGKFVSKQEGTTA